MIHFKDRAVVTADGREYPHDGTATDRRRAIAELQADIALQHEASNRRSIAERGRPCTPTELANGWKADDLRGPHERQADDQVRDSAFNPYEARLQILKAQRINSKEIPALEAKAASWTPPVIVAAPAESPYDMAINSLLTKPGHTSEERASTERQVAALRAAGDKWKQDQEKAAQAKAFDAMPERVNALENGAATLRMAELIPAIPSWHLEASKANLLALKNSTDADGGVKAYWAQQRKDNAALYAHQDAQKADWTKRGEQHDADMKAALSLAPVEAPVVVEQPKSAIEQALTGGTT
jgi:hypothetical protein